jgi:hypothetical protein
MWPASTRGRWKLKITNWWCIITLTFMKDFGGFCMYISGTEAQISDRWLWNRNANLERIHNEGQYTSSRRLAACLQKLTASAIAIFTQLLRFSASAFSASALQSALQISYSSSSPRPTPAPQMPKMPNSWVAVSKIALAARTASSLGARRWNLFDPVV